MLTVQANLYFTSVLAANLQQQSYDVNFLYLLYRARDGSYLFVRLRRYFYEP